MGALGWKTLGDFMILEGLWDHVAVTNEDGDVSLHVRTLGDEPLLRHDDVTNAGDYEGLIECEVRPPTGLLYHVVDWLNRIPHGGRVTVGGPWVSDCSHGNDGSWQAAFDIAGGVNFTRSLGMPDWMSAVLDPLGIGKSVQEQCCDHGKTEIHPMQYVLAPLGGTASTPGDIDTTERYLLLVLTDDSSTFAIYRPSLPPHSGEPVTVDFNVPFPHSPEISAGLTNGGIQPVCKVVEEVNHAESVELHPFVGEATVTDWIGDHAYNRAAFASINVKTGSGGYYFGVIELSFELTTPVENPPTEEEGIDDVVVPSPERHRLLPIHDAKAEAWNGKWADRPNGPTRIRVDIAPNADGADAGGHSVDLTDNVSSTILYKTDIRVSPMVIAPYKGDVGLLHPHTGGVHPDHPVILPGVDVGIGGAGGVHPDHSVILPGVDVEVGSVDTLPVENAISLILYGEYSPRKELLNYRVRYLRTADDGTILLDIMLKSYSDLR